MTYLEKRNKLPDKIKDFLDSDFPRQETEKICFMYGLKEDYISALTYPIGLIFIREIELKNLPKIISEKMPANQQVIYGLSFEPNSRIFARFPEYFTDALELLDQWEKLKTPPIISEDEAWKKVLEIEPWILEAEKEEKETERNKKEEIAKIQATIIKVAFSEALKNYPALGEQLITSSHIKLKNFPEAVRPSINNWLSDYTFNLGYDPHGSIVRGNYLFQSENARALNSTDREKIFYILKSYDENSPVEINTNTKQILFPNSKGSTFKIPKVEPLNATPQRNISEIYSRQAQVEKPQDVFQKERETRDIKNAGNMDFSSPQKLPYEKQAVQSAPAQNNPASPQPLRISSQNLREHNVPPGNIVNLKEQ